jgi:hypothetical protein
MLKASDLIDDCNEFGERVPTFQTRFLESLNAHEHLARARKREMQGRRLTKAERRARDAAAHNYER